MNEQHEADLSEEQNNKAMATLKEWAAGDGYDDPLEWACKEEGYFCGLLNEAYPSLAPVVDAAFVVENARYAYEFAPGPKTKSQYKEAQKTLRLTCESHEVPVPDL